MYKFSIYLKLIYIELIRPINYAVALFIGATINIAQGKTVFFSLVPYFVPILIQSFTKASINYGNKEKEILLMLPSECKDPAFVMNTKGKILASTGNSYDFFQQLGINDIRKLFDVQGTKRIFDAVGESRKKCCSTMLELYSQLVEKWYQIQVKEDPLNHYVLVWLENITERKTTEKKLAERMRHFEFISEIGFVLSKGGMVNEILQECTESMVRHLDAVFARIWILNDNENMLQLKASAGKYTHINGEHSRISFGEKKIGKIAKKCKAHLSNAVIGDPAISDQAWAKREKISSFAGHPLIFEGKVMGVMAMFSSQILSNSTIESLEAVADVIALTIENAKRYQQIKNAENKVRMENEKLEIAMSEIKTLSGLLPICASCKKIRDDNGYWNQLEGYIQENSAAKFSHGMCPECSDELYGKEDWYIEMKRRKNKY